MDLITTLTIAASNVRRMRDHIDETDYNKLSDARFNELRALMVKLVNMSREIDSLADRIHTERPKG